MRIAILGKNGQVGQACVKALSSHRLLALGRSDPGGDVRCLADLQRQLEAFSPDMIINATAFTAVDEAERDIQGAYDLNVRVPAFLAEFSKQRGAFFLHFSTDYVFDGCQQSAYVEAQLPHPINVYGQSKWEGEKAVLGANPEAVIMRLTWVHSAHHRNFIVSLVNWMQQRNAVSIVDDQWGIPTDATEVARGVRQLIECYEARKAFKRGVYHFASAGICSRYECAQYVRELLIKEGAISKDLVIHAVKTDYFPLPASRPSRAVLDHRLFDQTFDFYPRDWQIGVRETVLAQLKKESAVTAR